MAESISESNLIHILMSVYVYIYICIYIYNTYTYECVRIYIYSRVKFMQYTYECICIFIYAESNLIHILSSVYVYLYIWLSTVNAIAAKEPYKRDLYKEPYKRDSLLHIQIRYTKNYSHTLHYILGKRKRKTHCGETGRQTCRCGYVCLGPRRLWRLQQASPCVFTHMCSCLHACLSVCWCACLYMQIYIYMFYDFLSTSIFICLPIYIYLYMIITGEQALR